MSATAPPRYPDFPVARLSRKFPDCCPANVLDAEKPLSFLEIGVDLLGYHLDRLIAVELLAVDEKGRRRVDAELLGGAVAHLLDAVEHLLIRQAVVEGLLGKAELLGDIAQRLDRFLHHPFALLGEQRLDDRHEFVLAGAARQHEAGRGERVERKLAENETHLAGVDVAFLQFGKGGFRKVRAVRTGQRRVFDDRHRRLLRAKHDVAVRAGFGQRSQVRLGCFCLGCPHERRQNGSSGGCEREGRGSRKHAATGERQGRLLIVNASRKRKWCSTNVAPARPSAKTLCETLGKASRRQNSRHRRRYRLMAFRRGDQCRFTAAPSLAKAARKSSSAISGMVAATCAAAASSAAGADGRTERRSGAWRSVMRSTARQPRKRLTRSQIRWVRC